jgi:HAD superfamily hydrolase (TIGR01549 family)
MNKGMKSREWWHYIVKNVIEMDFAHKKLPPLPETVVDRISNEMFDQFSNAFYWKKNENCDMVLEKLKEKGVKLGIISNFDERLFEIIENLHIANHFEFVCIPANSKGHFKPQREIFLEAFKKTRLDDKNQMLHVGDDLKLDYHAAHAFGCKSLLILNKSVLSKDSGEYKEVLEKQDFVFELKDILEKV